MKKLGFGTMRLPLIGSGKQADIDFNHVCRMVDFFLDNGFTYVDTAYMYHDFKSEIAVKQALVERHPRDSFLLADKLPISMLKSKEEMLSTFQKQLDKCGVDFFDYYMLHDLTRQTFDKVNNWDAFGFLSCLKKDGKICNFGFSFHDKAELLDQILTAHPEVDFVQLQLNYIDWDDSIIQSGKCYEVCVKHGKKVIVMEPVKGGALANIPDTAGKLFSEYDFKASPASWAIRYAASLENVMVVLSGMSNLGQMEDNVSYMNDFQPLTNDERAVIEKVVETVKNSYAVPCTGCRYCVNHTPGCPMSIAIPDYFAIYNNAHQHGAEWGVMQAYRILKKEGGIPSDCIECGQCEEHCPQHISIISILKEIPKF